MNNRRKLVIICVIFISLLWGILSQFEDQLFATKIRSLIIAGLGIIFGVFVLKYGTKRYKDNKFPLYATWSQKPVFYLSGNTANFSRIIVIILSIFLILVLPAVTLIKAFYL